MIQKEKRKRGKERQREKQEEGRQERREVKEKGLTEADQLMGKDRRNSEDENNVLKDIWKLGENSC